MRFEVHRSTTSTNWRSNVAMLVYGLSLLVNWRVSAAALKPSMGQTLLKKYSNSETWKKTKNYRKQEHLLKKCGQQHANLPSKGRERPLQRHGARASALPHPSQQMQEPVPSLQLLCTPRGASGRTASVRPAHHSAAPISSTPAHCVPSSARP